MEICIIIFIIGCSGSFAQQFVSPRKADNPVKFQMNYFSPQDISRMAYENIPDFPKQPKVSWIPYYDNATGVIKFSFTSPMQGVKVTLAKSDWFGSQKGQWYLLKIRLKSDVAESSPVDTMSFLYHGILPGPLDLSGHGIRSTPTNWVTLQTYLESADDSPNNYFQLVLKNQNAPEANLYIDWVEILEIQKPSMEKCPFPGSIFDSSQDTTYWQLETPNYIRRLANYRITNNQLDLFFSGDTSQGLKMTMGNRPGVTWGIPDNPGNLAGMQLKVNYSGEIKNNSVMLAVYSVDSPGSVEYKDVGIYRRINRLNNGDNGTFSVYFIPQNPYFFGQLMLTNTGNGHFYLDDIFPLLDSHIYLENMNPTP